MITIRRTLLDRSLYRTTPLMRGKVLDIGGKKRSKRGRFRPPKDKVQSWSHLNSDPSTNPDCCCSGEDIPIADNSIDTIVMTEVMEYLSDPQQAISEVYRVLSFDGVGLFSVPFLVSIHGDHWADRQRFTELKLREMFKESGFRDIEIEPMGSIGAVIWDIMYVSAGYAWGVKGPLLSRMARFILYIFRPIIIFLDRMMPAQKRYITTGYFIIARK